MSDPKISRMFGIDGLVEFGEYLGALREASHRSYSFEMPDVSGRLVARSLDEVIGEFQDFVYARRPVFRVVILCVDRQAGTISSTDKQFKRASK